MRDIKRGFLNGPFLPIYGFGAIIMQNEKVLRMQKRLDVLLAFAGDDKNRVQARLAENREERQLKAAGRHREAERIKAELAALLREHFQK